VFTQVPPQRLPLEQAQDPPEQYWPEPQTRPHEPQFSRSLFVLTQVPLQRVPLEHAHVPPAQYWPDGHTRPQPPQLEPSLFVSTHVSPHSVRPGWQLVTMHDPPRHV
jgi:hypothetical protein